MSVKRTHSLSSIEQDIEDKRLKYEEMSHEKQMEYLMQLSNLVKQYSNNNDSEITQSLNEIVDDIPTLVVVGDQSSGKSSTLNNLFKLEITVNDDMTTKCPIEFIGTPDTETNEFNIINFENGTTDSYTTFEEAQQEIDKHDNIINVKLEWKFKCDKYMRIIDLPGCNNESDVQTHFSNYVDLYIRGHPQTIVLCVTKGDDDQRNLNFRPFLKGIDNTLIHIMTYVDNVGRDMVNQKSKLETYSKHYDKVFMIANHPDWEDEQAYKVFHLNHHDVSYGISALREYCFETLKENTKKKIPMIMDKLQSIYRFMID